MEYRKLTFTQVVGIHRMFVSFLDGQIVETSPVGVSSEVGVFDHCIVAVC